MFTYLLCIWIEILLRVHAKGGKGLNGFKFGTLIGHFSSDRAERMADCFTSTEARWLIRDGDGEE